MTNLMVCTQQSRHEDLENVPLKTLRCQFQISAAKKSQIACRSHMSLSGWWAVSAGCPRCKHLGDVYIGFGSDHLRVLICPVNTNYWVTRNWKNIVLCVCSNRYTYTPHSCITASVPLVPQCQARGCIPKRCGLWYVGGRCHIEKWTVDLYIYMSSSASARFLTLAQQTRRCVYMVCRVQLAKCSRPHVPIEASDGPFCGSCGSKILQSNNIRCI